jgi:hypothetical protein
MSYTKWIPKLAITMEKYSMTNDFFVVDVPDTNVVLGVQWIYSIGRYTTDHRTMEMEFTGLDGKKVVLRAMHQYPLKIVPSYNMEAIMRHGDIEWDVECFISNKKPPNHLHQLLEDLQVLLRKHHKVFSDIPPDIPPDKGFEHIIELEEGVQVVIKNPYRHPNVYKDEIEKTIKELLKMGHIRPSSNPFSYSIVLVKKKDNTLWMCIDYMALNKKMIKNYYPIPRIDELMDELRGAKCFSKIDLQSGYHHIKVREKDTPKITFRFHYGHYEFLFMPFGLTNSSATFHLCMNHVFNKKLRKFLLILFDDILIYNTTWEDHMRHIDEVLGIIESQ